MSSPNHSKQNGWTNCLSALYNDISASLKNNGVAFDPKVAVQNMIDLLREESAAEGKQVDDFFYEGLEDLKTDPDFIHFILTFLFFWLHYIYNTSANSGIAYEQKKNTIYKFQLALK